MTALNRTVEKIPRASAWNMKKKEMLENQAARRLLCSDAIININNSGSMCAAITQSVFCVRLRAKDTP
jgi:outer membrane receptor for Fe3+-dicitrate